MTSKAVILGTEGMTPEQMKYMTCIGELAALLRDTAPDYLKAQQMPEEEHWPIMMAAFEVVIAHLMLNYPVPQLGIGMFCDHVVMRLHDLAQLHPRAAGSLAMMQPVSRA